MEKGISIEFSKKQVLRTIETKDGNLNVIALPMQSKYPGATFLIDGSRCHESKFNDKMMYFYLKENSIITISYRKEDMSDEYIKKELSITELKEEMNSWKKEKENE